MKDTQKRPLRVAMVVAVAVLCGLGAQAQSKTKFIKIRKLDVDEVKPPVYSTNYSGGGGGDKWVQVTVEYNTLPEWIDRLEFRYFVMVESKRGERRRFTGDVAYVDIQRGSHESTMFLRPRTLARYGKPKGVAVEVSYHGEILLQEAEPKARGNVRWWRDTKYPQKTGYLLNRAQTPFIFIRYDDHEIIAPSGAGGF